MSGPTPGPWRAVRHHRGSWTVTDKYGSPEAPIAQLMSDDEDMANARLIAAAPDLYAACESLLTVALDCRDRWSRGHEARVEAARAALAAARPTPTEAR